MSTEGAEQKLVGSSMEEVGKCFGCLQLPDKEIFVDPEGKMYCSECTDKHVAPELHEQAKKDGTPLEAAFDLVSYKCPYENRGCPVKDLERGQVRNHSKECVYGDWFPLCKRLGFEQCGHLVNTLNFDSGVTHLVEKHGAQKRKLNKDHWNGTGKFLLYAEAGQGENGMLEPIILQGKFLTLVILPFMKNNCISFGAAVFDECRRRIVTEVENGRGEYFLTYRIMKRSGEGEGDTGFHLRWSVPAKLLTMATLDTFDGIPHCLFTHLDSLKNDFMCPETHALKIKIRLALHMKIERRGEEMEEDEMSDDFIDNSNRFYWSDHYPLDVAY